VSFLYFDGAEELSDMIAWLEDHPEDVPKEDREAAAAWLTGFFYKVEKIPGSKWGITRYRGTIEIPSALEAAIEGVIDDWAEVCAAHGDEFRSHITETAE